MSTIQIENLYGTTGRMIQSSLDEYRQGELDDAYSLLLEASSNMLELIEKMEKELIPPNPGRR